MNNCRVLTGIECNNCTMDSEFYCNPCHKQFCGECKEEHLKSLDFLHHDIVSLLQHQPTYLAENCTIHTTSAIISFCENCVVPLCFKCAASSEHKGHNFVNLRTTYAEKFDFCSKKISNIKDKLLPNSRARQDEIATGFAEVKNTIASLRMSVVAEASEVKEIVNKIVLENMGKLDSVEEKLLKDQETQSSNIKAYISYLEDLVDRYDVNLADKTLLELVALYKNTKEVKDLPHLPLPPVPEFVPGQANRPKISTILGSIRITENNNCNVTKENRLERKGSIFGLPSLCSVRKHKEKIFKISSVDGSMYQFSLIKKIVVPGVENILHISLDKLNKLWVSDLWGSLEQVDINGKVHKNLIANFGEHGFHAVTDDDDFLYTDQSKRVVNKVRNETTTQLISTEKWTPLSICFSRINGDVLVGMVKDHQGKIIRFTGAGIKVDSIQKSYRHVQHNLYEYPNYITESVNGDICASDSGKEAVVVVNKSGKHHFSYKGQKPKFIPYGICTDIHGYIMVCDGHCKNVHLLDPDGHFLFLILTTQEHCPQGLCVDDQYNLFVGQGSINEVTVYRYNR